MLVIHMANMANTFNFSFTLETAIQVIVHIPR